MEEQMGEEEHDLREGIEQLRSLIASVGWRTYSSLVESQCKLREQTYLYVPLPSADAVYAQEYAKGEIQALRLALGLPETMIENFQAELEAFTKPQENQDGG